MNSCVSREGEEASERQNNFGPRRIRKKQTRGVDFNKRTVTAHF